MGSYYNTMLNIFEKFEIFVETSLFTLRERGIK